MRTEQSYIEAINFTLEIAGDRGLQFLDMWRSADWEGISRDFPEFHSNHIKQSKG